MVFSAILIGTSIAMFLSPEVLRKKLGRKRR